MVRMARQHAVRPIQLLGDQHADEAVR
jgi:hypothetical protein